MSRLDLNNILAERGIPMHYGQKDLEEDLAYARSCQ
jgi:predicted HTH domain antitoxin